MRSRALWILFVACLVVVDDADATLSILKADGTEASTGEASRTYDEASGTWDITLHTLYAPGDFTVYTIRGDAGERIDDLIVDVEDPAHGCAPIGSPVIVNVVSAAPLGIESVARIMQTGTAETILSTLEIQGDLGSVEVEDIGVLTVGGDIHGPVRSTVCDNPSRGINMIEVQGDVLGDVTAENGRIIFILAYGRIGTAGAPVQVRARHDIIQIASYGGIHGDVTSRANGGHGRMFAFGATSFDGTLETEGLMTNPYSGWPGRINILDRFAGRISIAGAFDDPEQWIELPLDGLEGQIIFNADNDPAAQWTAPVYVGAPDDPDHVMLAGPGYHETAQSLGGGAVGLAPFDLHEESCLPPSGTVVSDETIAIALRHYGPVEITGSTPLDVHRREAGTSDPFLPVKLDAFEIGPSTDDANAIRIAATAGAGGFEPGYDYRIEATDDLAAAVAGRPPVAWSGTYLITVEASACPADIDGSGAVDFADLVRILGAWGPCPGCPEDLTDDGVVTFADLLAAIEAWGPC